MSDQLQRVYDALQAAHAAGDTQAATQLAAYARELQTQQTAEEEPKGLSDRYLHNPITYGIPGAIAGFALHKPIAAAGEKLTPKSTLRTPPAAGEQPVPPRAGPIAAPESVGPLGQGAVKNIEHNLGQQIGNKLHLGFQDKPVAGFNLRPGSLVITPTTLTNPPAAAAPSAPAAAPRASMPRMRSAMQAVPKPAGRAAVTSGMGIAAGSGIDALQQAREGNIAPAAASALSTAGGTAMMSSNPKIRALGGLASLLGIGSRYLLEPEEEKAAGGVIQGYAGKGLVEAVKGGLNAVKKFVPKETKIVKASEALGPHEGKYLHFTESDRMRSTGGDLGGPGFSKFQLEDPRYAEAQAAWGVASKPKATSIVNINKRFPEGQSLWTPLIGAEGQHRSNQHVYDALQNEFSRQASMGKLTPELRERMNKRLNTFPNYQKSNLQGIDVANPELLQQFGNTFDRRAAIAEVLGGEGVGGRKGQIFDYPGIMQEMSDPMTFGAPTHSAGTRLFSLNNEVEFRPDLHSAFPHILKGQDLGVAFAPVPKELAFKDWLDMARDFMGREPQYMDFSRGVKHQGHGRPHQFIDERFLRRLEEAGHKQGGLIALEE